MLPDKDINGRETSAASIVLLAESTRLITTNPSVVSSTVHCSFDSVILSGINTVLVLEEKFLRMTHRGEHCGVRCTTKLHLSETVREDRNSHKDF